VEEEEGEGGWRGGEGEGGWRVRGWRVRGWRG
jgi:hypothetical protein